MEKNYKISQEFIPDRRTPSEMDVDTLNLMCRQDDAGLMKCVQIVMSNDIRALTVGVGEEDMLKAIPIMQMTSGIELLRRAGKVEVKGELSFDFSKEWHIRKPK